MFERRNWPGAASSVSRSSTMPPSGEGEASSPVTSPDSCASTLRIVGPANGKIGRCCCTVSSRSTPQPAITSAVKLFAIDAIGRRSSTRAEPVANA